MVWRVPQPALSRCRAGLPALGAFPPAALGRPHGAGAGRPLPPPCCLPSQGRCEVWRGALQAHQSSHRSPHGWGGAPWPLHSFPKPCCGPRAAWPLSFLNMGVTSRGSPGWTKVGGGQSQPCPPLSRVLAARLPSPAGLWSPGRPSPPLPNAGQPKQAPPCPAPCTPSPAHSHDRPRHPGDPGCVQQRCWGRGQGAGAGGRCPGQGGASRGGGQLPVVMAEALRSLPQSARPGRSAGTAQAPASVRGPPATGSRGSACALLGGPGLTVGQVSGSHVPGSPNLPGLHDSWPCLGSPAWIPFGDPSPGLCLGSPAWITFGDPNSGLCLGSPGLSPGALQTPGQSTATARAHSNQPWVWTWASAAALWPCPRRVHALGTVSRGDRLTSGPQPSPGLWLVL